MQIDSRHYTDVPDKSTSEEEYETVAQQTIIASRSRDTKPVVIVFLGFVVILKDLISVSHGRGNS